jgi:hypothetical protein
MPSVRVRVTAGVGAWIVGAATATGLSLFAVSYLSADPHSPQGATLSQDQVKQALASISGTPGSTAPTDSSTPPGSSAPPADSVTAEPTPSESTSPTEPPSSTTSSHAAAGRSALPTQPVVRRLSDDGGTVVAQCQNSTVYLVSWSPAQGYQAVASQRGPAHVAEVVFTGYGRRIEFHVACVAGAPALVDDNGRVDY